MSIVARELAIPAILFPCFVALAFLLAVLLRKGCPALPPRYSRVLTSWWCISLVVLLSAGGILYLHEELLRSEVSIEADMMVSGGASVDLFLNDMLLPPYQSRVVGGQRHTYRFGKLPRNITLLRFDPTDQANAQVVIYGISVKYGDRVMRQFGPAELRNWTLSALSQPKEEAGGLAMTSVTDDPTMRTDLSIHIAGGLLEKWSPLLESGDGPFMLTIAAFLLMLVARAGTRPGRLQAVVIAIVSCTAFPLCIGIKKLHLLPPPVTSVVGYASYHGYAKANEILAAFLVMLVAIGLGCACAWWVGRRDKEPMEEAGPVSRRKYIWITHAAVLVVLALFFLPDFADILRSLPQTVYHNESWDYANFLFWAGLVSKGLRPYRDFWYPYGGFYIQLLRFPAGEIFSLIHVVAVNWFLYLALVKVTGRRLAQALAVYGMVMIPLLLGMMPGFHRYLMAVVVVIFYAAICEVKRLEWKTHLPFAVLTGYVCFSEPPQLVCAGGGILAHIALSALSRFQGESFRERLAGSWQVVKQYAIRIGLPMAAGVLAAALIYASNGMLGGIWDFERSIADQGDYGAVPADVGRWVLPALQPDTVFLLLFLVAGYAAYRWLRMRGREDPLGTALVVLSIAGFIAMQKQIVRPHVMSQVRVYPFVAVLILGLIVWRERQAAARIAIAMFLGSMLGIGVYLGVFRMIYHNDVQDGPRKLADTAEVLWHDSKESQEAAATLFNRSRFEGFDAQMAVVDNLNRECGLGPEDNVYVLGDDAIFYILLNQAPPYVSNSYNDSPIYEQRKILDWLRRKNPRFVILAPGGMEGLNFDAVPHVVRLPLIYNYIVETYGLLREVGSYRILTRRPANEPPNLDFWRKALGGRIDLGHVPERARLAEYGACEGDKTQCDAVLVVRYPEPAPVSQGQVKIGIASAGTDPFEIQFDVAPGEREYVVNLNRIWFWNALARSGKPEITGGDQRAQMFLGYHREPGPVLY